MECIFSTRKSYSLVRGFFSFKTLDKMMYVLLQFQKRKMVLQLNDLY